MSRRDLLKILYKTHTHKNLTDPKFLNCSVDDLYHIAVLAVHTCIIYISTRAFYQVKITVKLSLLPLNMHLFILLCFQTLQSEQQDQGSS